MRMVKIMETIIMRKRKMNLTTISINMKVEKIKNFQEFNLISVKKKLLKLNNYENMFEKYKDAINMKLKKLRRTADVGRAEISEKVDEFNNQLDCVSLVYDIKVLKEKVEFLLSQNPLYVSELESSLLHPSDDHDSEPNSKYEINEINEPNIFMRQFPMRKRRKRSIIPNIHQFRMEE